MARPHGRYRLAWSTPAMTAPSFWYLDTESEAIDAAAGLQALSQWSIGRSGAPVHICGLVSEVSS